MIKGFRDLRVCCGKITGTGSKAFKSTALFPVEKSRVISSLLSRSNYLHLLSVAPSLSSPIRRSPTSPSFRSAPTPDDVIPITASSQNSTQSSSPRRLEGCRRLEFFLPISNRVLPVDLRAAGARTSGEKAGASSSSSSFFFTRRRQFGELKTPHNRLPELHRRPDINRQTAPPVSSSPMVEYLSSGVYRPGFAVGEGNRRSSEDGAPFTPAHPRFSVLIQLCFSFDSILFLLPL
ncbi:hypothetical protein LXL04_008477 [Taraxacum kok-saghyz]